MNRNLDINLLRAFVAVAVAGNMTRAASRLNLTQGAMSQRIGRLEDTLQCSLFDRSRRGLKPTKRGEQLLGLSRRLLALNDEIWREMTEPDIQGEVRLGIPDDLVPTYLPIALDGFSDANPDVEVTLVGGASSELLAALRDGEADVVLVEQPDSQTSGEILCVERLFWVGKRNGVAFQKRPLPLSIVSELCVFRPAVFDALGAKDVSWRSVYENGNLDATMTTVRADMAITASLASFVPDDLEVLGAESGLPELPSFAIALYLRDPDPGPAALELARHLREGVIERGRRA
ncbi:MAG: LysR family transcriptional regulator [Alphaproteobacteria bacterium]|nr:LysR family transcriptional regulator [Alphaproteobacteria bacterium]